MPFNPAHPADDSPLDAGEMRAQLTSLDADIQSRVTQPQLNAAAAINATLPQTSANSNAVSTLNLVVDSSYNPSQLQDMANKIDELLNALRR